MAVPEERMSLGGGGEVSGGIIKDSFLVLGTLKAQAGFTVYRVRFKVSVVCIARSLYSGVAC